MAIEIVPPEEIKKVSWLKVISYLCILLLILGVATYFMFDLVQERYHQRIQDLEKDLAKTPEEKTLEEEVLGIKRKIDDFNLLLVLHQLPLNIFTLLEESTHPKVWFSDFGLDSEKGVSNISGEADSFEVLSQQISLLKEKEFIKNLNLSGVSLGKEGGVNFSFGLILAPQLFK